ncbi:MAG: DMT family transporter [Polyangiaceae bacterium]
MRETAAQEKPVADSASESPATPLDYGLVILAAIAFATSSPLAKAAKELAPLAIGSVRCFVASIAITLLFPRRTFRALVALSPRGRLRLFGAGFLLAAHFGFFLAGLAGTSLSAAASLVSLEPLAVVLAAFFAFGVRPKISEAVGVAFAAAGAAWIGHGAGVGENRLIGDLFVVLAVAIYGAYVMAARSMKDEISGWPYAAGVYFIAAVLLAPLALLQSSGDPAPSSRTWLYVFLLGIIPTMIGHTLVQRSARHVHPSVVALISPGETVGSIGIGMALQGTRPSSSEWCGAALVILGVICAVFGPKKRSQA